MDPLKLGNSPGPRPEVVERQVKERVDSAVKEGRFQRNEEG